MSKKFHILDPPKQGNPTKSLHLGIKLASELGNIDGMHIEEDFDASRFKVGGSRLKHAAKLFDSKQL